MERPALVLRQLQFTFGLMTMILEPGALVFARHELDGTWSAVIEGIYGCDGLTDQDLAILARRP